jgi:hypothetical protein
MTKIKHQHIFLYINKRDSNHNTLNIKLTIKLYFHIQYALMGREVVETMERIQHVY